MVVWRFFSGQFIAILVFSNIFVGIHQKYHYGGEDDYLRNKLKFDGYDLFLVNHFKPNKYYRKFFAPQIEPQGAYLSFTGVLTLFFQNWQQKKDFGQLSHNEAQDNLERSFPQNSIKQIKFCLKLFWCSIWATLGCW